ncbi:MAG TPA: lysylphosphatidylglycerol synthase transmembrane domain-containing protein [Gemmatimonadota bacterium]|jgi:hypothetical protein
MAAGPVRVGEPEATPPSEDPGSPGRRFGPRRIAETAAALVLLYFLGAYLARHWAEIASYPWQVAPGPLLAASALATVSLAAGAGTWIGILRAMGERVGMREALPVYFVAALARYIPGKLWQLSGLFYLSRRRGIDAMHALAASVLLQVLVIAVGLLLFVVTLPARLAEIGGLGAEVAVPAVAAILVALYLSPAFERLYAWALKLLGRPPIAERFSVRQKLVLGAGVCLLWISWGLSFWLFVGATTGRYPPLVPALGICAAGYVGGFLAFFSPGGLGVRESLYAILLGPYVPPSVALAVALVNRVWLTLIEIGLALVSLGLAARRDFTAPETPEARLTSDA